MSDDPILDEVAAVIAARRGDDPEDVRQRLQDRGSEWLWRFVRPAIDATEQALYASEDGEVASVTEK